DGGGDGGFDEGGGGLPEEGGWGGDRRGSGGRRHSRAGCAGGEGGAGGVAVAVTLTLVEHHHLAGESIHVAHMREPAGGRKGAKIFREIARVIRLVEALREKLEHPVIVGLIAILQRVEQNEAAAGLEHARELSERLCSHLRRQLVEQINARHRVLARVRDRQRLALRD